MWKYNIVIIEQYLTVCYEISDISRNKLKKLEMIYDSFFNYEKYLLLNRNGKDKRT